MPPTRPLGNQSVVVVRAPLTPNARDGTLERNWAAATRTTVSGCSVQPFKLAEKLNFEDNREREFARTALRVFAPAGTDIESTDRMEYGGKTFDVFGHAGSWNEFSGAQHHVAFVARLREG